MKPRKKKRFLTKQSSRSDGTYHLSNHHIQDLASPHRTGLLQQYQESKLSFQRMGSLCHPDAGRHPQLKRIHPETK